LACRIFFRHFRNQDKIELSQAPFGFVDFVLKDNRANRRLVGIEQRDVVIRDLVKEHDDVHEICVRFAGRPLRDKTIVVNSRPQRPRSPLA
jgi:hypothetical protein